MQSMQFPCGPTSLLRGGVDLLQDPRLWNTLQLLNMMNFTMGWKNAYVYPFSPNTLTVPLNVLYFHLYYRRKGLCQGNVVLCCMFVCIAYFLHLSVDNPGWFWILAVMKRNTATPSIQLHDFTSLDISAWVALWYNSCTLNFAMNCHTVFNIYQKHTKTSLSLHLHQYLPLATFDKSL